ncbi:MAG TPA: triose-phosphate isomerase [Gemmatimonadaceae bacterium]|nr:triose-phosphate isomerase [Gemmatimonadaceae bacterium]
MTAGAPNAKPPIFAANWKMNSGPTETRAFMRAFLARYARRPDRTVMFFPPALTLAAVRDALKERGDILVGVQNIHWEAKGAYTGENSAGIAKDAGATHVLVGHSERRHVFGETDEQSGRKVGAALAAGLIPMLCVGEKLDERERGQTEAVVVRQLRAGLANLANAQVATVIIAYEPVWAIGTGKTATPADASAVHVAIRGELRRIAGDHGNALPILYGGSVNAQNVRALLDAEGVDGVLVGGASLDAEGWATIVRS